MDYEKIFPFGADVFLFLFLWSAGSAQAFSLFKDESAYKEGLKLWKSKQYGNPPSPSRRP